MTPEELKRRYTYHAPDDYARGLHDEIRSLERNFARTLDEMLPDESREKALMLTKLEEAVFWAHAHIARNVTR